MSHPFCDEPRTVISDRGAVVSNTCVAQNTFRLCLSALRIVPLVRPGQFVMLRLPNRSDPLLGRPLAVYQTTSEGLLEVVYLVVGKMTARLAELKADDPLEIWGPLGNGFQTTEETTKYDRMVMIAGGIGQTPFLMLAEQWIEQLGGESVTLLFGARTKDRICCMDDFRQAGVKVSIATDDGSEGYHGPVAQLLPMAVSETHHTKVLCCGPLPMLRSAFAECQKLGLPCDVSLESPMACGLGICFSCVVEYQRGDAAYEYVRTCFKGPVFDAYRLKW